MTDIDRARSRAYSSGVFSHDNGGGVHVGTHRDGDLGTFAGIYTRDDRGSVREWLRVLPNGHVGVGTDQPKYPLDINGIVRLRAYLMSDLPAGEIGCLVFGIDHRHGPGTGCLMVHNGAAWEEAGKLQTTAQPSDVRVPDVSGLLARLDVLEREYAALRHAFENHGHAHDALIGGAADDHDTTDADGALSVRP